MVLDRRGFLRSACAGAVLPWLAACAPLLSGRPSPRPFGHGVASGDPGSDRVILWTRVTPAFGERRALRVDWEVARDPLFARAVAAGVAHAAPERDFTVKLDVTGLAPATTYYYRFAAGGVRSPIGRTRTLPEGSPERLRLAFASCAAIQWGFFAAYARIAERADLDAVLHLGDYLYESAEGEYGSGARLGRAPVPDHECLTLDDYRTRHAQYKTDPDLQELHRQHPVIALWDDHELANDAWRGGAQNHQPGEGSWAERRAAAVRAYREWLPIRDRDAREPGRAGGGAEAAPQRGFRFGDLADLSMLETRLARDPQVYDLELRAAHADPGRSLLGAAQERWLAQRMLASQRDGVAWRLLGQQVVFAPMRDPQGRIRNPDSWDGYAATRERLYALWEAHGLRDNLVLTGDVHSSWALDVPRDPYAAGGYDAGPGGDVYAVEFVTPGITSPSGVPLEQRAAATRSALAENPHLRWVELHSRGYALLDLDRQRAQCEWYHVETVERRDAPERLAAAFRAGRGGQGLVRVAGASAPIEGRAPLAP